MGPIPTINASVNADTDVGGNETSVKQCASCNHQRYANANVLCEHGFTKENCEGLLTFLSVVHIFAQRVVMCVDEKQILISMTHNVTSMRCGIEPIINKQR